MNKEEFLQMLRRDLSGDVPQAVLEENVQYYREYIDGEVSKGRTEEEVVEELGTPRLIAKNIEDTTELDQEEAEGYFRDGYSGGGYAQEDYTQEDYSRGAGGRESGNAGRTGGSFHLFDFSKWYGKLALFLLVFAIIYLVFTIVTGLFAFFMPILLPLLVIWAVISVIRYFWRR